MNEITELLQSIKTDLLSRRLLPVLVVSTIVFIGAVGYAAVSAGSTSPSPAPAPTPPAVGSTGTVPVSVAPANPNEAVAETPGGTRFQSKAPERDPFVPLPGVKQGAGPSAGGASSKGSSGEPASSTGKSGTPSTGGAATGGSAPATPGQPAKPPVKSPAEPRHAGLTPTESYGVAISLTTLTGDLNTIDPLERLGALPSEQQPLLVYLGVLEGGHDALFLVQPGTVIGGPASCIPGPTDCEIISLAAGQIESLGVATPGGTAIVAMFAVTAIKVEHHPSTASAMHARREASAAGEALVKGSTRAVLPLFEYRPDAGAVVDLRDLQAGAEK